MHFEPKSKYFRTKHLGLNFSFNICCYHNLKLFSYFFTQITYNITIFKLILKINEKF